MLTFVMIRVKRPPILGVYTVVGPSVAGLYSTCTHSMVCLHTTSTHHMHGRERDTQRPRPLGQSSEVRARLCASQQHPRASFFWDLFVRASSASQRHPKTIPASQIQSKRFSKSDVRGCACHPSNLVLGMTHPSEGPFHPK